MGPKMPSYELLWSSIQAVALIAGVGVAGYQLWALRRDQRAWKTLEACDNYDFDPVLNDVLSKLRDARDAGDLADNPRPLRMEATVLLNYLEGIATGLEQGFYNARVVRDHLEPIFRDHVSEFLEPEMARRMEIDTRAYSKLKSLIAKWDSQRPSYKY
jgi:hypothetical protein